MTDSHVETQPMIEAAQDEPGGPGADQATPVMRTSGVTAPSSNRGAPKPPPAETVDQPQLWSGDSVDHYEVKLLLGRGSMGEVYLAKDSKLGRKVALKLMRPDMFQNPGAVARFEHEARSLARINHPNVVTIHTVGQYHEVPYVAMEYVRGEPLSDCFVSGVETEQALHVAIETAKGLREAHAHGIVHRDLKPENIIVAPDGRVVVLDFGLAKMVDLPMEDSFGGATPIPTGSQFATVVGTTVGTPMYMSPEQWRGEKVTAASDVWSLGVILYEMFTGRVPFEGADVADLAVKICSPSCQPAFDHRVPAPLWTLTMACLQRDPVQRPTVDELIAKLERQAKRLPGAAAALSQPPPQSVHEPPSRRRTWMLAAAAAVVLAGGVAIGMSIAGGADDAESAAAAAPAASPEPAATREPATSTDLAAAVERAPATASATTSTAVPTASASTSAVARPKRPTRRPAPQPKRKPADPFSEPPASAGY